MNKSVRRPQRQKRSKVHQVQELRRSNAAGAHKQLDKYEDIVDEDNDLDIGLFDWLEDDA